MQDRKKGEKGQFFHPKIALKFSTGKALRQICCSRPKLQIKMKANHNYHKGDEWEKNVVPDLSYR
jgi:hypothetical protein